jgi:replicative DNA helicase
MKQPPIDLPLEYGMPAAVDVEKVLLGALLNAQPIANVANVLRAHDFFLERHRRIFAVMLHLESAGKPINRVTVLTELRSRKQLEADGISYLASLDESMPEIVTLDAFVSIVHDKSILRQAILAHQKAIDECLLAIDPTPAILERAERSISALATETHSVSFRAPAEVLAAAGGMSAIVNGSRACWRRQPESYTAESYASGAACSHRRVRRAERYALFVVR